MKFLIDECLRPDLAKAARRRGFGESTHVSWLGLAGTKDWRLLPLILDGDWSFVTKNSDDFRGPTDRPGSKGLYAGVAIHAGLVCLNGPESMDRDRQEVLFAMALDEIGHGDLINQVVDIHDDGRGQVKLVRFALPAP